MRRWFFLALYLQKTINILYSWSLYIVKFVVIRVFRLNNMPSMVLHFSRIFQDRLRLEKARLGPNRHRIFPKHFARLRPINKNFCDQLWRVTGLGFNCFHQLIINTRRAKYSQFIQIRHNNMFWPMRCIYWKS